MVGECSVSAGKQKMRLSLEANGIVTNRRSSRGKPARVVWHLDGARVARQRYAVLRDGQENIPPPAVGRKALNAAWLCGKTAISFTTVAG